MKDLIYIYDKTSPYARHELGEIQSDFNLSFVIDGTKDSAKVEVFNFSDIEVEPYSIVKHKATNTWWVISHDKVERLPNENGYWYKHNLELLGAIELCNARDLTDCGFNANKYTVNSLFTRLVKLSTFEFPYSLALNDAIDGDKIVDYVKTFENYTLLSALREFFDGYNCAIKLEFNENGSGNLTSGVFTLMSKTGNVNDGIIDDETDNIFNNVQELKTLDKASFGTSVISNAENVISTKAKTYPTSGIVKATGNAYRFGADVPNSIVVRLPSNIYRVNYVELVKEDVKFTIVSGDDGQVIQVKYNPCNDNSIINAYNSIKAKAYDLGIGSDFEENIKIETLKEYGKRRFYYEDNYDPINKNFVSNNYIPIRRTWTNYNRQTVLSNSEMKNNVEEKDNVFYFERGKDIIEGFTFFGENPEAQDGSYNAVRFYALNEGLVYTTWNSGTKYRFFIGDFTLMANGNVSDTYQRFYLPNMGFVVNYIPMSDIKIKLDNNGTSRDTKQYNQNGKLTDSIALSKSLLSYSKEIESDNITKYGTFYYEYSNGSISGFIPKVGSLVKLENKSDLYVINNVSLDFYPNEYNEGENDSKLSYYIRGEFTLSKNIAVKSLMVNPNTNIRDYGIPQNFNVKRKQLYRDFYELGHSHDTNADYDWYLALTKVLNVGNEYEPYQDHTGVIMLSFNGSYAGNYDWYYQLESTTFVMKKSIYEIIDFKDNNIIGYGSQNVWSGFDITRLLGNQYDLTNTPISYVDLNGEFKDIKIAFCTNEQLTNAYDSYMLSTGKDFSNSSYGAFYSCFIPSDIFENGNYGVKNNTKNDFMITEDDYYKDATEVPVFEYCCQVDDSDDVIIGSNVLDTYQEDNAYLYSFVFVEKGKYNDNNFSLASINTPTINNNVANVVNGADLSLSISDLDISIYSDTTYDLENETLSKGTRLSFEAYLEDYDLMIIRHKFVDSNLQPHILGELISLQAYDSLPTPIADYYGKMAILKDNDGDKNYTCYLVAPSGVYLANTTIYSEAQFNNLNPEDYYGFGYDTITYYVDSGISGAKYLYVQDDKLTRSMANDGIPSNGVSGYYSIILDDYYSENYPGIAPSYNWNIKFTANFYNSVSGNTTSATINFYSGNTLTGQITSNGQSIILSNTDIRQMTHYTISHNHSFDVDVNLKIEVIDNNNVVRNDYYKPFTLNFYLPTGSITITDSGTYQLSFYKTTRPPTYYYYLWLYSGGSWQNTDVKPQNGEYFNNNGNYYYWDNSSETLIQVYPKKYYRVSPSSRFAWGTPVELVGGELGQTSEPSNYVFTIIGNNASWVLNNQYEWREGVNANGKYFMYNNNYYRYDSITHTFNQYVINTNIGKDLMFIIRNLDNATIVKDQYDNETLRLKVNHYKIH